MPKVRDQLRDILVTIAHDGEDCARGNLNRADVKERIDERIDEVFAIPEIKSNQEQILKAVMYVWHLAYDACLLDVYGRYTKEMEGKKRPPPNATELAKEAGFTVEEE